MTQIDDILKRRKLPIIVGGTDYYIESILWESLTSGPPIEADELVEKHCHVINTPQSVNKWRTFEASVRPTLDEEMFSDMASRCKTSKLETTSITVDMVTRMSDMIERLVDEFRECALGISNELNINTSMYLQTFYRLPGSSRADHTVDESQRLLSEPESFNFVDAELALLNYYLHVCLQKLVRKLVDDCDDDWRPDEMCREFLSQCWDSPAVVNVINEAVISSVDFGESLEKLCELSTSPNFLAKCHEAISVVYDNLKMITEIRTARLKLLRISDDAAMLDYMNDELYSELKLVDSKSTDFIHPNNRRKIIR